MFDKLSTIQGTFKCNDIEVKYWSKYDDDGKTMYFKPNKDTLPAIKGMRRNTSMRYYTKRTVNVKLVLKDILSAYGHR